MATASIENGELVIRMPLKKAPTPSSSGKTMIVATTGGFTQTAANIAGKNIAVSVNATITR